MASLTVADVASRMGPVSEGKKPKRWIAKAIGHPGAFRKKAEAVGESTREFASEHKGDSGKTGAQARLATTLMSMNHKSKSRSNLYKKD